MTVTIAELYNQFGWAGLGDAFYENGLNADQTLKPRADLPADLKPLVAYAFANWMTTVDADVTLPKLTPETQSFINAVGENQTPLMLSTEQYEQIRFRHGPSFPDTLCQQAYEAYHEACKTVDERFGWSKESTTAAINFLGSICDYYLAKLDGDFMEIRRADTWQR